MDGANPQPNGTDVWAHFRRSRSPPPRTAPEPLTGQQSDALSARLLTDTANDIAEARDTLLDFFTTSLSVRTVADGRPYRLTHPAALGLLAYLNETLYAAEDTARGLAQTLANDGIYAITDFTDLASTFEQGIRGHHHVSSRSTRLPPVFESFRAVTDLAARPSP